MAKVSPTGKRSGGCSRELTAGVGHHSDSITNHGDKEQKQSPLREY